VVIRERLSNKFEKIAQDCSKHNANLGSFFISAKKSEGK
jgi:hypothetical protein